MAVIYSWAGGLGRETEFCLGAILEGDRYWELAGYLNDISDALDDVPSNVKVLGSITDYEFPENSLAIMAIADSQGKRKIYEVLKDKVEFFTFIHPTAIISEFAKIGYGSIIFPYCVISTNVELGIFTMVNAGSFLGHDSTVGDFSSLMAHVDLGGFVEIGQDVFMGTKSTVIPNKRVCDSVTIGVGSVVVRDVKQPCTLFGNPARRIN